MHEKVYISFSFFFYQTQLLEDHIKELKRVLKPGAKRLNWNSLGISDYITRCGQVTREILKHLIMLIIVYHR